MSANIAPPESLHASYHSRRDFHAIERRYSALVFGTALRCLGCHGMAQEVTQDVFLLLAKKGARVPSENPAGWLHRTAVLKARERLRAENRYRRRVAEYARQQADSPSSAANAQPEMELILERLDGALNKLPERERRIIFLRYFEGLDARAMAARLGITPEAAQKQCERARSRLAEKLAITGALTAGVLRAQLATGGSAAWSAPLPRPPLATAGSAGRWIRRKSVLTFSAAAGIFAGLYFLPAWQTGGGMLALLSPPGAMRARVVSDVAPPLTDAFPASAAPDKRRGSAGGGLDLATLAALLERADEADAAAAAAAESMLARQDISGLCSAADSIPALTLPPNQLRVLALGVLEHLVTRDGRAAVLTGERLWRAQHGASAPRLASLVNEGLAKWAQEDHAAATKWYAETAASRLFEDRGHLQDENEFEDHTDFPRAMEMERTARDLTSRAALARRVLLSQEPRDGQSDAPSWQMMADVWAHKLTPADARELADALWSRDDLPAPQVFQFRQAIVTLPTVPPSLESLRWAATRPGREDMEAALAALIVSAWQQRHPAGAAAWLATLEGLPEGSWISRALQDAESAAPASPFHPSPAEPTP